MKTIKDTGEKNYYFVTFQYSENIFCTNLAIASQIEDVIDQYESEFSGKDFLVKDWLSVRLATEYEIEPAKRRGMPVVEIDSKVEKSKQPVFSTEDYGPEKAVNSKSKEKSIDK